MWIVCEVLESISEETTVGILVGLIGRISEGIFGKILERISGEIYQGFFGKKIFN